MILEHGLVHYSELDPGLGREALDRNRAVWALSPLPGGCDPLVVQAVLASNLCRTLARSGGVRRLPSGAEVQCLDRIDAPPPAEYARLISKGRILYEHCMAEVSSACVIGFMHHELTKSRAARRVVLDLVGWMLEQRLLLADLVPEEGEDALARMAHTDYMLDQGVSFLHGLDRAAAADLAADKEP